MYLCPFMSCSKKETMCAKNCALRVGEECAFAVNTQERIGNNERLDKIIQVLNDMKHKI